MWKRKLGSLRPLQRERRYCHERLDICRDMWVHRETSYHKRRRSGYGRTTWIWSGCRETCILRTQIIPHSLSWIGRENCVCKVFRGSILKTWRWLQILRHCYRKSNVWSYLIHRYWHHFKAPFRDHPPQDSHQIIYGACPSFSFVYNIPSTNLVAWCYLRWSR